MPGIPVAVVQIPALSVEEKALLLAVGMVGEFEFSSVLKKDRGLVDMLVSLERRGLVVIKPLHQETRSDLSDFTQLAHLSSLGSKVAEILETTLAQAAEHLPEKNTEPAQRIWQ